MAKLLMLLVLLGLSIARLAAASTCSPLDGFCSNDTPCCERAHDCFAGKCVAAVYIPSHGEKCNDKCAHSCSSRGESCVKGVCTGPMEDCSLKGEECNVEKGCCDPSHDCIPLSDAPVPPIWERAGVCKPSNAASTGEKCDDSTPCRFRFDTCTDGVCEISAAGLIDVSAFTVVRTSATSFDPRLEVEGGCGVTMGCTASRTRDGKSKPASRWSCSEKLRKGKCALTYSFDAPQDVRGLRMAFHEGDHSRHTLRVSADGKEVAMLRSSGQTLDFQNWDIDAKSASTLTLEAVDLNPNYWIHITEVEILTRNQLAC